MFKSFLEKQKGFPRQSLKQLLPNNSIIFILLIEVISFL